MKKIFILLMLLIYSISMFPINTFALTDDVLYEELTASKISVLDPEKVGEYDIKIKVPGKEKTAVSGYNFLFVVDASTSTNGTKWNSMRQAIVDVVSVLLPESDSDKNINKVALMTFGIGEHLNVPLTSDKSKFNDLPTNAGQSMLLPGRSATNNEVGLSGAYNYLNNLSSDLKKNPNRTYVIYLTDGYSNLNEKEVNYYEVAKNSYWATMKIEAFRSLLSFYYYNEIDRTQFITDALNEINEIDETLFETCIDSIRKVRETINANTALNANQKKNEINKQTDKILSDYCTGVLDEMITNYLESLYNIIGYTDKTAKYSAGQYERMINSYKFSDNIEFQQTAENTLYYPIFSVGGSRLENANRAVAAGMKLKEIATIYTIGYSSTSSLGRDDANKIMNPNFNDFKDSNYSANTPENHFSSGYYFTTIKEVVDVFNSLTADLIYTNYVNTTIVDYTSKWVIPMDVNNDGVFDEKDIVVKNNNEVVDGNLVVEKLSNDDIKNSTDEEINGNTSESIYKITWTLPDKFKHDDHYELSYRVKVDTEENNFVSDKEYKANGKTTITYDVIETGPNGEKVIADDIVNDILVPTVKQKENVVVITKKDDTGKLLSGADFEISGTEKMNQVKVLYSKDGTNWDNNKDGAVYFKFIGLYDANYDIKETVIPSGYNNSDSSLNYNFVNLEGQVKEVDVINTAIKGSAIIKYVIKIDGEYIPLNVYGKDSDGNNTPDFEGVNLDDETLSGILGDSFATEYREIPEYSFVGLYKDSISDNNKLDGNTVNGTFSDGEQVFIYVYEPPMGGGNIDIPVTGIENDLGFMPKLCLFILFTSVLGYSWYRINKEN